MIGTISAGFAAAALLAAADVAWAQNPPTDENGRYALSATDKGYLRLDTRTGAVSICTRKDGWTCRVVPDERAALDQEIGRLQAQVDTLKAQLSSGRESAKGSSEEPPAGRDSLKNDAPQAPAAASEAERKSAQADVGRDAAVSQGASSQSGLAAAFDGAWRQLVDIAVCVRKTISDII
ncbi:hypothetical protein [Afipia felis]